VCAREFLLQLSHRQSMSPLETGLDECKLAALALLTERILEAALVDALLQVDDVRDVRLPHVDLALGSARLQGEGRGSDKTPGSMMNCSLYGQALLKYRSRFSLRPSKLLAIAVEVTTIISCLMGLLACKRYPAPNTHEQRGDADLELVEMLLNLVARGALVSLGDEVALACAPLGG